jgi:hypothetical protein
MGRETTQADHSTNLISHNNTSLCKFRFDRSVVPSASGSSRKATQAMRFLVSQGRSCEISLRPGSIIQRWTMISTYT